MAARGTAAALMLALLGMPALATAQTGQTAEPVSEGTAPVFGGAADAEFGRGEPADAAAGAPGLGSGLLAPPAMSETGRVGDMRIRDPIQVDRPSRVPVSSEAAVTPLRAGQLPPGDLVGPPSAADRRQIDIEANRLLDELRGCRVEVARLLQMQPADITVPDLEVRWTITRAGSTTDSEVVASGPVDPQVTSCIKRRLSTWQFSPLSRGPARVVYSLAMR